MLKNDLFNFVCKDFSLSEVSSIIYDSLFLEKKQNRNIYAVISGAENIGASWLSLTIAHTLNKQNNKVLVVDGVGNFSNILEYLYLQNSLFIEDYISGKKTLNQLISAYKNKDFNILTGKSGNNYIATAPLGRTQVLASDLQIIADSYDYSFIDIGNELSPNNIALCNIANEIIILCSENNTDMVKTFDIIKSINESGLNVKYSLIVNKVNSYEDGYKVYERLSSVMEKNGLNFPNLLGIIRFDARIRDTIKNKELLLNRYPESEAALDICEIVKKIEQGL